MALHNKNIGRENDLYPIWDVDGAVNNVGSDLAVGDLVIFDWTAEGDVCSLISPSSALLITTHVKAIVKKQTNGSGIASGARGSVRIQGPIDAGIYTGHAFTRGDPISPVAAPNATDGGLVGIPVVGAPGTNATYIQQTVGACLVTTASAGTAQTMRVIFDGTNINAIYLKD